MPLPAAALAAIRGSVVDSLAGALSLGRVRGPMGIGVTMSLDTKKMERDLKRLGGIHKRAMIAALNRTMDRVFTRTVKEIVDEKGIPRKQLTQNAGKRGRIRKYPASAKRPRCKVWIGHGKMIPVPASASAKVAGWGKSKIKKALGGKHSKPFRATVTNKYSGKTHAGYFARRAVSERISKGGRTKNTKRKNLPIVEVAADLVYVDLMPEAETILDKHATRQQRKVYPKEYERIMRTKVRI